MDSVAQLPITLAVARSYPLEPAVQTDERAFVRSLVADGRRVEVLAESPDEEEFVQVEPDGTLVHRIAPERAYTRKLAHPRLWRPGSGFAVRAWEKACELTRLWNRALVGVEVCGPSGDARFLNSVVRPGLEPLLPARRWAQCRSVSVICPTYNRVDELVATLASLLDGLSEAGRAGIDCELLVVFQNEGTPERVLSRRPEWKDAPLRWIPSAPGLPHARNVGSREARGDLHVFVDDDVVLDPGFVRAHLEAANAWPTSAGSAGRVRSRILGERGARNRAVGQLRLSAFVDTHFDSLATTPIAPHTPQGANMAFKREAMQAYFGPDWFDERLEGSAHREETTLCVELFRRGGHLVFAREASLLHLEAESGGCENRLKGSSRREIDHLALDYLFLRRFFRDLGPLSAIAPLSFFLREVRLEEQDKLRRAYLNGRGYLEGLARFRRFEAPR